VAAAVLPRGDGDAPRPPRLRGARAQRGARRLGGVGCRPTRRTLVRLRSGRRSRSSAGGGGSMSTELHEPAEHLSDELKDLKRAIDSMREELEAVDWYRQRAEACRDPRLKAILDHHQREELEHFAMLLEWCRRNDKDFDEQLR